MLFVERNGILKESERSLIGKIAFCFCFLIYIYVYFIKTNQKIDGT